MNIYISHSRSFDFQKELYGPLKNSELAKSHEFIFPHDERDEPFNTKELLYSKGCDLVIAEVSYPSTGQGIELGWADVYEIPIVCVYKEGVQISQSLGVVSKKLLMYTSAENMIEDIAGALKQYD